MITSLKEYVLLLEDNDADVRRTLATEEASAQTWHVILDNRPDLASEVAINKKLPSEIVDRLIATGCNRTRSLVAMKRALTNEQFQRLASDMNESVRALIASNKKTPIAILEHLAHDESEIVLGAAKAQMSYRCDT
jgi:hypothetical protein